MSVTVDIRNVSVEFPFKPYDIQKDYMEKVIECIENETTAVLESPTGTGKTLSLLCSSLAWLQKKKAEVQAQGQLASKSQIFLNGPEDVEPPDCLKNSLDLDEKADNISRKRKFLDPPTIIYASRTHSQLSQAIQELKRTAYSHLTAGVLGSRDHLCIHPEVLAERDNAMKLHMCHLKVESQSCPYKNRVEKMKVSKEVLDDSIIDIEDMVKLGNKHIFCPYFMTKERRAEADIIFTPYNYLLDPIARMALGLDLKNAIVIFDEGHNVERMCEESASIDIKSSDLALAIDETTHVMKMISETPRLFQELGKDDIDPENLPKLKLILIGFKKALDEVNLNSVRDEIPHFPGDFVYDLLKTVQVTRSNESKIVSLIGDMIQCLMMQKEGRFARKGKGLQLFSEFLAIVFRNNASKEKIRHCYKVYIKDEVKRPGKPHIQTWLNKRATAETDRVLSYWCFSPSFGIGYIVSRGVKALILTSGTLAPLGPLISELELDVRITLENSHVVDANQICVKILPKGPDGEPLNSCYRNRDNPKYVTSLGRTIVNLSRIIPHGLLIFFSTYLIMEKCHIAWKAEGIWDNILSQKAIFVEPKGKDAFNAAMTGYYEKIRDPNLKGAIFMAVCGGKVSEGLDFVDSNGRAVIITGLPNPPVKDPRIILKKRYLDACHAKDKTYLTGEDWYSLLASRTVNQAVGRVIRHRYDYGAILLLDERFNSFEIKEQMSKWLRDHIKVVHKYGEIIRDLSQFFRKAQSELPAPQLKPLVPPRATFEAPAAYRKGNGDVSTSSISFVSTPSDGSLTADQPSNSEERVSKYLGTTDNPNGSITIRSSKRERHDLFSNPSRRKIYVISKSRGPQPDDQSDEQSVLKASMGEYVVMMKTKLGSNFGKFANHLKAYRETKDIETFIESVDPLVPQHIRYVLIGIDTYIVGHQKSVYRDFLRKNNLTIP